MANLLKHCSLEALQARCEDTVLDFIANYNRTDYSYGCTFLSFNQYLHPSTYSQFSKSFAGVLLMPSLGIFDVVVRVFQEKKTFYFHTHDGVYLGSTINEAIDRANEIGEQKMKEREYEKARSYFNIAYYLCSDSRENEFKRKRDTAENEREREQKEMERVRRERERKEMERVRREREQKEMKRAREMREQREREQGARNNYEQGLLLWNEAFSLEESNKDTEANTKFHMSKNLLVAAAGLVPNNEMYRNWVEASNLKIEGDELFNEGQALHEEGRRLCDTQKYEEALAKYREAKAKYTAGLIRVEDSRFQACIEIVNENERSSQRELMQAQLQRLEVKDSTSQQRGIATHLQANVGVSHCVISPHYFV